MLWPAEALRCCALVVRLGSLSPISEVWGLGTKPLGSPLPAAVGLGTGALSLSTLVLPVLVLGLLPLLTGQLRRPSHFTVGGVCLGTGAQEHSWKHCC